MCHCSEELLLDSDKFVVLFTDQVGREKRDTMAVALSFKPVVAGLIAYAFRTGVCVVAERLEVVIGVYPESRGPDCPQTVRTGNMRGFSA